MQKFVLALAMLAFAAAPAEAERVRFQGHFLIKLATADCTKYNPVNTRGNVHFEPVISGTDNGDTASFVLYQDLHAKGYRLKAPGNFGVNANPSLGFKAVDTLYSGDNFGHDDSVPDVFAKFVSQAPATFTTSTNFVNIVAQIRNFDFMPKCTVTVHMAMIRRLD